MKDSFDHAAVRDIMRERDQHAARLLIVLKEVEFAASLVGCAEANVSDMVDCPRCRDVAMNTLDGLAKLKAWLQERC